MSTRLKINRFSLLLSIVFIIIPVSDYCRNNFTEVHGYILYCPCMGRFGNQAEQLLGSLLFAKSLNRTLVLPPFISYDDNHSAVLTPFEDIIQINPLKEYHDVMSLEEFMHKYSNKLWPPGKREFYCYSPRNPNVINPTCDALKGQPFNFFWSNFQVSEDSSVFYKPLVTTANDAHAWNQRYPASSHRVITFVGSPSPFPAPSDAIHIQKYVKISDKIRELALDFKVRHHMLNTTYLSMHIRHGPDWVKACELLLTDGGLYRLFSSDQCIETGAGRSQSNERLKFDLCLPSFESISDKIEEVLRDLSSARDTTVEVIHMATDLDDTSLLRKLSLRFPRIRFVSTLREPKTLSPMIDVFLMTHADVLIGNCISSFSAFAARIRKEQLKLGQWTYYFGHDRSTSFASNVPRSDL